MAEERKPATSTGPRMSELDDIALQIYSQRMAANGLHLPAEHEALQAYRQATEFLAMRDKVRAGELERAADPKAPKGPKALQDCFAPNRPPTDPHNLCSQEFGDREQINKVVTWLRANPPLEKDDDKLEQIGRFNRVFPGFNYDIPTLNTARALLPAYATVN